VAHVRTEVDGIDLGGLISIEGIVTDLKVTSNGESVLKEGGTKLSGLRVLGREAVLDGKGIRFTEATTGEIPTLLAPVKDLLGPLVDALGPVLDGLGPATKGIGQLLDGDPTGLQTVLEESGISIGIAGPRFSGEGGAGSFESAGVVLSFDADLDETPLNQLVAVLDALPPPPDVPGLPIQPIDLLAAIRARHVGQIGLGAGRVSTTASPLVAPTETPSTSVPLQSPSLPTDSISSSPTPATGSGSAPSAPAVEPSQDLDRVGVRLPLGELVGWRMVMLGLALALAASAFTRRLPDVALAAHGSHCDLPEDRKLTL
jgi:hypothetical protein